MTEVEQCEPGDALISSKPGACRSFKVWPHDPSNAIERPDKPATRPGRAGPPRLSPHATQSTSQYESWSVLPLRDATRDFHRLTYRGWLVDCMHVG